MPEPGKPILYPQPSQLAPYANAGWAYVRLHHWSDTRALPPDKDGKVKILKLGKAPIGKGWQKSGISLETAVEHMNTGKNVGAPIPEGWAVIDVDPRNFPPNRKVLKEFQERTQFALGPLASVITGAGGRHFFVRVPADFKGAVHHPDFPGVEFKQHGVQVVCAGSIHPDTQKHYHWATSQLSFQDAPEAPESVLALFRIQAPAGAGSSKAAGSWSSLTPEQIEVGLDKLNPADFSDQEEWFGLMCSVHWLTGGEALQTWIDWSTSDPHYADHEEIISLRWDSLSRGADSGQLVAKGGLFFKALKTVGVNPGDAEWQITPEKDFQDYDEEEFIADKAKVQLTVQAHTDQVVKTQGGMIANMNERHFVLDHKGKTVVGRIRKDEDDHGAEITVYSFSDVGSFKNYYANQMVKVAQGDPLPLAEWWFHHPSRLTYSKMEFRPDRTQGSYRDNEGLVLNQWTGFAIEPKSGDWSLFDDLLKNTICHGDMIKYEYLLNWFAAAYQRLDGPIGTAVAINGLKGTGKTTVWEVFSAPWGSNHAMSTSRMEELFGDFNGRMMGKAALLIEEALFASSQTADNQLKDWITGSKVSINEKFLPAYSQRNYLRVLIFTNGDHIVRATEDERRYFITKALPNRKGQVEFWKALREQMFEQGGTQAFFHDMLNRDIGDWDAQFDCPVTRELVEQIGLTRGAVVDWLLEKFDFGQEQFTYAWNNKKGEFLIPIFEMWSDFSHWQSTKTKGRFDNPIKSQSGFSRELKRIFGGDHGEDLPLTTGSVPESMNLEIRAVESMISGKIYHIAKVYRFHNYQAFYGQFAKKYGMEELYYNPASDEDDDEPDFGITEEEDIGFGI